MPFDGPGNMALGGALTVAGAIRAGITVLGGGTSGKLDATPASVPVFATGGSIAIPFGLILSSLGLNRSGDSNGSFALGNGGAGSFTMSGSIAVGSSSDRPVGMTLSFVPCPNMSRWAVLGASAGLTSSFGIGGGGRMTIFSSEAGLLPEIANGVASGFFLSGGFRGTDGPSAIAVESGAFGIVLRRSLMRFSAILFSRSLVLNNGADSGPLTAADAIESGVGSGGFTKPGSLKAGGAGGVAAGLCIQPNKTSPGRHGFLVAGSTGLLEAAWFGSATGELDPTGAGGLTAGVTPTWFVAGGGNIPIGTGVPTVCAGSTPTGAGCGTIGDGAKPVCVGRTPTGVGCGAIGVGA